MYNEIEVIILVKLINNLNLKNEEKVILVGIRNQDIPEDVKSVVGKLKEKNSKIFQLGQITSYYPFSEFATKRIVFIGLGEKEKYELKDIQTIFSKVAKEIKEAVVLYMDSFQCLNSNINYLTEKVIETIFLVNYEFNNYKTNKLEKSDVEIEVYSKHDITQAIEYGVINAESTNNARTLVNEPRNKMTPTILAEYAVKLAKKLNIEYRIYNKKEIEKLGMGAFLAVNQGSSDEAKLIHFKYRNAGDDPITALVGKGLTYDSGGYSLKPKNGMAGMKGDMGGSATVLGAIELIVRKKLKVNVDVIIAATENLISSDAIVPDDVVVTMSGKTIEILNTDAEGRLTLVDAVTFARENNAAKIIDVATLTGGVVTALGTDITGAFTNNKEFLAEVRHASENNGEMIWELPVDPFREQCKKSEVADYNNSPGRAGHASYGAAIIAEFALDTPWIHLDIAGTSDKKAPYLLGPAGATGVMVRTLASLFE